MRKHRAALHIVQALILQELRSRLLAGGLEGCKPSKIFDFSGSARATALAEPEKGNVGEASPPQAPPLRKSCHFTGVTWSPATQLDLAYGSMVLTDHVHFGYYARRR